MTFWRALFGRRDRRELELELDASLAARALARRRGATQRERVRARCREMLAELGRPIPPELQERDQ